jgi:hypothetical protein
MDFGYYTQERAYLDPPPEPMDLELRETLEGYLEDLFYEEWSENREKDNL